MSSHALGNMQDRGAIYTLPFVSQDFIGMSGCPDEEKKEGGKWQA
jgi:hypothetical protein